MLGLFGFAEHDHKKCLQERRLPYHKAMISLNTSFWTSKRDGIWKPRTKYNINTNVVRYIYLTVGLHARFHYVLATAMAVSNTLN